MKIDRVAVFNKCGGRCAYCGCEIALKSFQVDHAWPQFRSHQRPGLDPNRFENLLPSCRKCNNFKGAYPIDGQYGSCFRRELGLQVARLCKNAQFDRALRFGQVQITESPVVFYYETLPEVKESVLASHNNGKPT